jgi:hypothetical protein
LARHAFTPARLPGEATVQGLPDEPEPVRVAVVGGVDGGANVMGGQEVTLIPHAETTVLVLLAANTLDSDGDGVPDAIDDCPSTYDPDQSNAAGSGAGDACRPQDGGSVDAGATDAGASDAGTADLGCGSPCTASNPGACAAGTTVCDGHGGVSCVPNVTTQSCYTGPAGTANVGVCRAGTQSCIGTLGACTGQVQPASIEGCFNNTDDDCDGTINNGCPIAIATGTPRSLTVRGNPSGGSAYSLRCPANSFVSKTSISVDTAAQFISGVTITCATPKLVTGTSSYSVTLTPVTPQPYGAVIGSATNGGPVGSDDCGTSSFAAGWYMSGTVESSGLDSVGMSCATGSVSFTPANDHLSFSFSRQNPSTIFSAFNGGTAFEDDCGANEVLIGYDGRDGNWLDVMQVVCAPLVAVYK